MVTMFSEYCSEKFSVEPVDVIYETADGGVESTETTPRLSSRMAEAQLTDICSVIGVELDAPTVCELCTKMQLGPASYDEATGTISVTVPPTRSDILHAVDIIEDVAIAYVGHSTPPTTPTTTTTTYLPTLHYPPPATHQQPTSPPPDPSDPPPDPSHPPGTASTSSSRARCHPRRRSAGRCLSTTSATSCGTRSRVRGSPRSSLTACV